MTSKVGSSGSKNSSQAKFHLYDTLTRSERAISPSDGQTYRFYCCGPTVYGPAHIGNFRTFVIQDVFRRTLEASGIATKHVRNITDVDDKTIRQSQAEGKSLSEFCSYWKDRFHADSDALNILSPHSEPSAVAHLPEQIELIKKLVDKKFAYVSKDGSVYFSVASFPDYGHLSRLSERSITTDKKNTSDSVADAELNDEYDRDSAADFALWKARRPEDGPNFWESPWGEGRPGWHIECSAMAMKELGPNLDLHGGGVDLVFPHHENEIAQSEAATGQTFANHWFHVAHLLVEGSKMSKSLGNLYTLEDLTAKGFHPEDLRYALIAGNYRQPLNFTIDSLRAAQSARARLCDLREKLGPTPQIFSAKKPLDFGEFQPVFDALLDDLNTPEALGRLFPLVKNALQKIDSGQLSQTRLDALSANFAAVQYAFGFKLEKAAAATAPPEIEALAQRRWEAKQARDWPTADALRNELDQAGWIVKDAADGFKLSQKK
ncbi:MAG: cysteine--tRNA ligase [Chthoniobacterales bacterium]